MADAEDKLVKSTSVADDRDDQNTIELLTDTLVVQFSAIQEGYVQRTRLSDDQVRHFIHTYLWLSTLSNGFGRAVNPATNVQETLSDYQEPAAVSGMLCAPSLVTMSDEDDAYFTVADKYYFDAKQVVDPTEFQKLWAKLRKAVNTRGMQMQMVPVKTSQRELLDSSYPRIYKGKVAGFKKDEAVKLPYILKSSVSVYSDDHFWKDAQDYFKAFLNNFFDNLASSSARPESTHVASKPVPVKDASTKKDEK